MENVSQIASLQKTEMGALSLPKNDIGSIPFFVFVKKLLESLDTGRTFVNASQAAFDLQQQLELYPKH